MREAAYKEVINGAKEILYGNLKVGYSAWAKENYKYISPSRRHYPHQWFWDSCFHAIIATHFDLDLAKNEIRSLLKGQRADGFIPHIIFWKREIALREIFRSLESYPTLFPRTSQLIQPPLLAQAIEAIYKKEQKTDFLNEVLPKLVAYYNWLYFNRDIDKDGLISIIAPYESGLDQSSSYDPIFGMKNGALLIPTLAGRLVTFRNMISNYNLKKILSADYFNVEDVLVNSVYLKNLQVLAKLLNEIDCEETARHFYYLYTNGKESLIKKCYDKKEAFFFDLHGKDEKVAKVKTIKGLMPLILDLPKGIAKDLVKKHLANKDEFDLPYPIPSVAANEPSFIPGYKTVFREPVLWRGPTWICTNWFIANGLREHGFQDESEKIVARSLALVQKSGFREYFNPFSGEGYGAQTFSWSTLVVDMISPT
jgi:glycogen debranching enzyme